ncbi:DUF397 domain-containing protein [Streptomyces anandii]|uniref:DUF397 domain-containing protein n=1 Tax=Streptomyces anandii TaxID=285454 RepID=UPI000B0726DF|nr:DUF397 domain-containing protein [Streptomyces anandii]GGX87018.1 DUF397 domain-containing protein [Streptomyces anandii JCM 4720]
MTASQPNWFKSSYSGGSGTECVECAVVADDVLIHDSKWVGGPVIGVRADAWRAFVRDALKRSPLH